MKIEHESKRILFIFTLEWNKVMKCEFNFTLIIIMIYYYYRYSQVLIAIEIYKQFIRENFLEEIPVFIASLYWT